jgi:hypothetical protein
MSARRDDEYDDLAALLDDLEATLARLREELDRRRDGRDDAPRRGGTDDRPTDRRRDERSGFVPGPGSDRGPSRDDSPRSMGNYSLPALVALLEATSRLLDAVSRTLRESEAGRSGRGGEYGDAHRDDPWARGRGRPTGPVGSAASEALDRALAELRRALSEADLPDEGGVGTLFEDARRLSREVSDRVEDARRDVERRGRRDDGWSRRESDDSAGGDDRSSPIRIEVEDDADDGTDEEEGDTGRGGEAVGEDTDDDGVTIDVEAELDSIREEVNGGKTGSEAAEQDDGDAAGSDQTEHAPGDEEAADDENGDEDGQ